MIATSDALLRIPAPFRKRLGKASSRRFVHEVLRKSALNSVCEEARCPNMGECFANKTATFMILGDTCTRRCHFCAVKTGRPQAIDPREPKHLVDAAQSLELEHVVITSVDRDDLSDLGASHFAACIEALRSAMPATRVEVLTPDFKGKSDLVDIVLDAKPDVFNHNIETVERLYKKLRPQSHWTKTCDVLRHASSKGSLVKSGMMVGLGESDDEVMDTLRLLKDLGVRIVTIGQYLRPSLKHWPVSRYVGSESYQSFIEFGNSLGFLHVFAGAFVRSSYHAKEAHAHALANT